MSWSNLIEPPRRVEGAAHGGMVGGGPGASGALLGPPPPGASWINQFEPPRMTNPGIIGGGMIKQEDLRTAPGATAQYQTFPEVPEKVGGGIGGNDRYDLPSDEYMDIANNVALSKNYAHNFMENWPLYLGGTAVVLYLLLK